MNVPLLVANVLTLSAFVIHTFVGDRELKVNEPAEGTDVDFQKREKWTMARCAWHWVSVDLLLASIGLGLVNFTDRLSNESDVLQVLAIYFFSCAVAWVLVILTSKQFPKNFLKLGQWALLLLIGGLIYVGAS